MSGPVDDLEDAALEKLSHISPDVPIMFTQAEADALREVALWWTRFKGASAIGGALGHVAKWFLLFIAFFAAMKAGLLDWLQAGGGQ